MKQAPTNTACACDLLSPEAFAAAMTDELERIDPAQPPQQSIIERLAPHRPVLVAMRKKGYTPQQLAAVLKGPKFGVNVSVASLRRLIAQAPRQRKATPGKLKYRAIETAPENAAGD